eukprot:1483688-Prymnesium_polylepis.1
MDVSHDRLQPTLWRPAWTSSACLSKRLTLKNASTGGRSCTPDSRSAASEDMPRRTPPPPPQALPPQAPPPQAPPPQAPPPQQEPPTLPPSSVVGVREVSFHTAQEVFSLVSLPDRRRGGAATQWLVQGELEWILYHHEHTTGAMYRLIKRTQEAFDLCDDETLVLRSSSVGKGMITAVEWAVVPCNQTHR